jgi:hypothetical protein
MLRMLSSDLWVTERPQRFLGFEMGTRMTAVRLTDGGLFVHSPVRLDAATRTALDARGPVRAVVAPNKYHHLYVGDYFTAYPEAEISAAPGLPEKRRDLRFHGVLTDEAPPLWAGQIDQLVFRALAVTNDVIFCHRRSRTLIVTDLVFNLRTTRSLATRLFFQLDDAYGKFGPSRLWRLLMHDRTAARAAVDRILTWDFDRVIMAHGDVLESGGRQALRDSFGWLLTDH